MIKNKDLFIMRYTYGQKEKSRAHIVKEVNSNNKYVVKVQSWKPMYKSFKGMEYIRVDQCEEPYPFKVPSCIDTSKLFYMKDVVVPKELILNNLNNYTRINNVVEQMSNYRTIELDRDNILKQNELMVCGITKRNHYHGTL